MPSILALDQTTREWVPQRETTMAPQPVLQREKILQQLGMGPQTRNFHQEWAPMYRMPTEPVQV